MLRPSSVRTAAAYLFGSAVMPIMVGSLVPLFAPTRFVKGIIQVPFWDGFLIISLALTVVSMVSSVLYLSCLKLGKTIPRDGKSIVVGLLTTMTAIALLVATGQDLFFFLAHFGFSAGAGLFVKTPEPGLTA